MAEQFPLEVGIAATDITPPVGVRLVGYSPRTSTAVGHPLRAEAIVVRAPGGTSWAMVTSDVIGYPRPFVQRVRGAVASRTSLAADAVMITATHTHSGPATVELRDVDLSDLERTYNDELVEKLAGLIASAETDLQPARFEVAWAEAPKLGSNRRVRLQDGTWTNEWRDPDGRHTGYFDASVLIVAVRRSDGRPDALLVNYGCHPVVLGRASTVISADYVGYLKDALETTGATKTAMFALAAAANINPRVCTTVGSDQPRAMGEQLARIVVDALERLEPVASLPVAAAVWPWNLTRTRPAASGADRPGRRIGDVIETEIQALRAGDLGIVAIPGELFSEYAAKLRAESPTPHTIIASLANDYIGYLPTNEALEQGAYEAAHAPADDIEGPLMAAARRSLESIAKR